MHHNPWLSILIPAYNVELYLKDCIESIANQIETGIEIIVLDDCSTDNSFSLLQKLAINLTASITIKQHTINRGVSIARNTLLDCATGTYVWFIDPDDVINPMAIAELKKIITEHAPDLVMCDFTVWRQIQKPKHRWRGENHVSSFHGQKNTYLQDPIKLFEGIFESANLHLWSKISKRALWGNDLRCPEGRVIMEDVITTAQLFLRVTSYYYQPTPWISYRQREGSSLKILTQKQIDDASVACAGILPLWLQKYPQLSNKARLHFSYFCVKVHLYVTRNTRKLHKTTNPDLHLYRQRFFEHIQWDKAQLYWRFVKQGWWLRLLRFIREH